MSPVVISSPALKASWSWLVHELPVRLNDPHCTSCAYDRKNWSDAQNVQLLNPSVADKLATLYLASQLCHVAQITAMAAGGAAPQALCSAPLDHDLKGILQASDRFRASLGEHLAFWSRLAEAAQSGGKTPRFALTQPNLQPEDKGPDCIHLEESGGKFHLEVLSVKNSINNPAPLVSSKAFRDGRKGLNPKKQLDQFWLLVHRNSGVTRVSNDVYSLSEAVGLTPTEQLRIGLAAECTYNAVVVADNQHANSKMFDGFERVTPVKSRRKATYLGSVSWAKVAQATRASVIERLKNAGVW